MIHVDFTPKNSILKTDHPILINLSKTLKKQ